MCILSAECIYTEYIYCSVTQFRQKRSKKKPWENLPRFALSPLCYQLCPLIALSLSIVGSRFWATEWHLNSLTCVLVPCSLTPSMCCQDRAACLGVQFYHPFPWHETLSKGKWALYGMASVQNLTIIQGTGKH